MIGDGAIPGTGVAIKPDGASVTGAAAARNPAKGIKDRSGCIGIVIKENLPAETAASGRTVDCETRICRGGSIEEINRANCSAAEPLATKFCVAPESLTMPVPLIVSMTIDAVKVNALALGLKTMLFTVTALARLMPVVLEAPNVATSALPLGTVAGVQFAAVFQSPLVGLRFQVALPANEWAAIKQEKRQMTGKSFFMLRSQQKTAAISR